MPYRVGLPPPTTFQTQPPGVSPIDKKPVRPVRPVITGGGSPLGKLAADLGTGRLAPDDDPILPFEVWYPEFHLLHIQVVAETPDLHWGSVRERTPDLYQQIKDLENRLDCLGGAKLSEVIAILREWRELIFRAYRDQKDEA